MDNLKNLLTELRHNTQIKIIITGQVFLMEKAIVLGKQPYQSPAVTFKMKVPCMATVPNLFQSTCVLAPPQTTDIYHQLNLNHPCYQSILQRLSLSLLFICPHVLCISNICITATSFKQAQAQTPARCWVCCLSNYADWTISHFPLLPTETSNRIHLNCYVKCHGIGNRSLTEIWFCFQDRFPLCKFQT